MNVKPKPVDYRTAEYNEREERRKLLRMLMDGTYGFRKEAEEWMPVEHPDQKKVHPGEVHSDYALKKVRTVVDSYFKRAVKRAADTVLSEPVRLLEDNPEPITQWWENVDLEGNNGDVFFHGVLIDSLGDAGVSWVLADQQPVPPGASIAQRQSLGLRPYLVHVRDRDMLERVMEVRNGVTVTAMVRIREDVKEKDASDPFGEPVAKKRVRVLRAAPEQAEVAPDDADDLTRQRLESEFATWELWQKQGDTDESWAVIDFGTMEPHQQIPIRPVWTGKQEGGSAESVSPFEDLAYLNWLHTLSMSDLQDSIHISTGAVFHRTGISEDERGQRIVGGRTGITSTNPDAKAEFIERGGTAAQVAMENLDRQELRMRALGMEPLARRVGSDTATGRKIDYSEAQTETQAWALGTKDAIEGCLADMAKYLGVDAGSVEVSIPEPVTDITIEELKLLLEMNIAVGQPSVVRILERLQAKGLLPDDLVPEKEIAMMEDGPINDEDAEMEPEPEMTEPE